MSVSFRSLCSGSSGNAVTIWDAETRLLVDCGVRAQYRCRDMFDAHLSGAPALEGVVLSHLHSDHINYASLRVIEERRVPVYVHADNVALLRQRHFGKWTFDDLEIRTFGDTAFRIGGFELRPVPVPHAEHPTHGFVVTRGSGRRKVRIVLATDLSDWVEAAQDFLDADFIYLEANHDPDLLAANPNPNSAFHLENRVAAELLSEILASSRRPPQAVMLAHLSDKRNTPRTALDTVRSVLEGAGHASPPLHVAPRHEPSDTLVVE